MTTTEHAMHEHEHTGHAGHAGHGDHVAQFRRLFWVMAVLAVPTVALSPMFAMLLGYSIPDLPGARWISPVLGTVMYIWGGRPFLTVKSASGSSGGLASAGAAPSAGSQRGLRGG